MVSYGSALAPVGPPESGPLVAQTGPLSLRIGPFVGNSAAQEGAWHAQPRAERFADRALAGELGLEPRITVPKTAVLPLHHPPAGTAPLGLGLSRRPGR